MADQSRSQLLGTAALVVWGDVNSDEVDESALNDWWTNEHLPERLSIPGFHRARRYCSRDDNMKETKYLTLYEVAGLEVLTSEAYMEKLNNPTPSTKEQLPTLAKMQRSACRVIRSEVRKDLKSCGAGLGGSIAMFAFSAPPGEETSNPLCRSLRKAFSIIQQDYKTLMAVSVVQEDLAATEPGSTSQSYINVNLTPASDNETVKWLVFFEFSDIARQLSKSGQSMMERLGNDLLSDCRTLGEVKFDIYAFMCCASV